MGNAFHQIVFTVFLAFPSLICCLGEEYLKVVLWKRLEDFFLKNTCLKKKYSFTGRHLKVRTHLQKMWARKRSL